MNAPSGVSMRSLWAASLVIAPANIDRLAAALRVLGWKLIYGLNLARGSPAEAADEAAYVANAVGTNLLAFQIGNEPDGFGRWTGVRPASYDVPAYLAEWRTFHASIRARVPGALFAGRDVSGATDWVAAFAEAMSEGLVLLTHHYYADGPAGAPHVSLPKLVQSSRQLPPLLERLAQYSRRDRLPYRIVETNSIYDEGQPGVSDTWAQRSGASQTHVPGCSGGAAGNEFPWWRSQSPRERRQGLYTDRA